MSNLESGTKLYVYMYDIHTISTYILYNMIFGYKCVMLEERINAFIDND